METKPAGPETSPSPWSGLAVAGIWLVALQVALFGLYIGLYAVALVPELLSQSGGYDGGEMVFTGASAVAGLATVIATPIIAAKLSGQALASGKPSAAS